MASWGGVGGRSVQRVPSSNVIKDDQQAPRDLKQPKQLVVSHHH